MPAPLPADAGAAQEEPFTRQDVVFFPVDFFDRMLPAQSELVGRNLQPGYRPPSGTGPLARTCLEHQAMAAIVHHFRQPARVYATDPKRPSEAHGKANFVSQWQGRHQHGSTQSTAYPLRFGEVAKQMGPPPRRPIAEIANRHFSTT